jgi:glutamate formiminotransferase/formiminotetrahydrofolate cyclodeaminase
MPAIVECVPNFSEGRDQAKIKAIADAIGGVPGVDLLNIDIGPGANRTVMTFVGGPMEVAEAAFQAIAKAAEVIDMRRHHGAHPRLGATDVLPFVPIGGITLAECAKLARQAGRRVGEELGISVFFYEAAATKSYRKNLADIRHGQYEGLAEKLHDPRWKPDCGPAVFQPKTGATVIGAREFLIAYNITLNTKDREAAADIAGQLRESGRVVQTATGQSVRRPGEFKACKAIGWYIEEYGRAQISLNLTDYRKTPPHLVFERAKQLAADRGLSVTGSEVIGMIPYAALLEAGKYYLRREGRSLRIPSLDILQAAVDALGLNDLRPFDVSRKVIGLPPRLKS